jgi:hypothetical protein
MSYQPAARTAAILDRAWELIDVTPYRVTARWLFYVLLQEGWYSGKTAYKDSFLKALSKARKGLYKSWRPDTLEDDTRAAVIRGKGFNSIGEWLTEIPRYFPCQLDRWREQDHYVELWFEARGMVDQFRYYTEHITLRPMGGQPSIDYKWQTAKALEDAGQRYDAPIVVLYFGDLDTGGEVISEVVEREVRGWCAYDFEFIRCGLTMDQVIKYGVPENIDKPGDYQWEALAGDLEYAAGEIIQESIEPYVRHDALSKLDDVEGAATDRLRDELKQMSDRWSNGA